MHREGETFIGKLHGHAVFYYDGKKIKLDTCGYLTTTTMAAMAAMADFARGFGFPLSCSRAKSKFSCRFMLRDYDSENNKTITLNTP